MGGAGNHSIGGDADHRKPDLPYPEEFPEESRGREIFLLLEQGLLPCSPDREEELSKLFEP